MGSASGSDGKRYLSRRADPTEIAPASNATVVRTDGHMRLFLNQTVPNLRGEFLVDCGMVCIDFGTTDACFLAMPRGLDDYVAGGATGMPLLHPYANRLAVDDFDAYGVHFDASEAPRDRHGLPIHGTMHGRPFTCEGLFVRDRLATPELPARTVAHAITVAEYDTPDLLRAFPFPHRLSILVALDTSTMRVTTEVHNRSDQPMPVSFGWHPFFRLPSGPRSDWVLRLPACRRHVLDDRLLPTGETVEQPEDHSPVGDRTYDDHFDLSADRTFAIGDGTRTLTIDFDEHYGHAQIYLPGPDAPLTGDFVCIEPMVANTNALVAETAPTVEPDGHFSASFSITVT